MNKRNNQLLKILIIVVLYIFFLLNISYSSFQGGFFATAIDHIYFIDALSQSHSFDLSSQKEAYALLFKEDTGLFGHTLIVIFISKIANIPPINIMYLPVAGIVSSIVYYQINKGIFQDSFISFLLTCYFILFSATTELRGGYVAGWSFLLFYIFILTSLKLSLILGHDGKKNNFHYILILLLSYIGIMSIWHTMEIRALSFFFTLNILIYIVTLIDKKCEYITKSNLLVSFFVISLTFQTIWYRVMANSSTDLLVESYSEVLSKFVNLFSPIKIYSYTSEYYYIPPKTILNSIFLNLEILILILIFVPIIISIILNDINNIKNKKISRLDLVKWSIIISYFVVAFLYGLQGGAGPGLIFYTFPIASTISIIQLTKRKLKSWNLRQVLSIYIILIIILQFGMTTILINKSKETQYKSNYENAYYSSSWFYDHTTIQNNVTSSTLTDFYTAGLYLVNGAKQANSFNYIVWSTKSYEKIVTYQRTEQTYLVINYNDLNKSLLLNQGWTHLKPLSLYQKEISQNEHLNKIYFDGMFVLYRMK